MNFLHAYIPRDRFEITQFPLVIWKLQIISIEKVINYVYRYDICYENDRKKEIIKMICCDLHDMLVIMRAAKE